MKVLGIDTSTRTMSIALLEDEKILGEMNFYSNMDHSEKLVENIKFLLESNQIMPKDLDIISVAIGPGSFTGIRIGIATAMGISDFKNIGTVGVSSLETLAFNFSNEDEVAICVDAKRNEVYGAIYNFKENTYIEDLYDFEEFLEILNSHKNIVIAGDMIDKIKYLKDDYFRYADSQNNLNRAINLCLIAKDRFEKYGEEAFVKPEANYLTKSQAERDIEKKNNK